MPLDCRLKLVGFYIVSAAIAAMNSCAPAAVAQTTDPAASVLGQTGKEEATFSPLPDYRPSTKVLDQSLFGPEIWRLPPVGGGPKMPAALTLPPSSLVHAPPSAESRPPKEGSDSTANQPSDDSSGKQGPESPPLELPTEEIAVVPNPWNGSFTLGLDGSEGNSETVNFRFGLHAKRKVTSNALSLDLDYYKTSSDEKTTANRLFFDGRWEWLVANTPRTWYCHETIEYDEFQSFDVRDTTDLGMGYRLIDNESATLISRFGGGFSHEYGGPANGVYVPEIVFGLQAEYQYSKRQKLLGLAEYAPDLGDFGHYRLRAQAALEALLDEDRNLSLRIGVLERYTSQSNGAKPNDLDYALMLMWKF